MFDWLPVLEFSVGHVDRRPKHHNAFGFSFSTIALSSDPRTLSGVTHRYSAITANFTKVTAMTQMNVPDLRNPRGYIRLGAHSSAKVR